MPEKTAYTGITIKNLPDSEALITGELPEGALVRYRERALKDLAEHVTLQGFRKGHIPERVLISTVGEMAVLEESASLALSDVYPAILAEHHLDALGRPRITLTKLAPGNPVGFSIETAILPRVTLPDYRACAAKINTQADDLLVEEKEIDEAIRHVRENVARSRRGNTSAASSAQKSEEETESALPELTDEFVRELGEFKDVADFKEKLTERMREEKVLRAQEKKRIAIADELAARSEATLPKILIESELAKMLGRLKQDLKQANISFENYLSHLKKTEGDIRNEWSEEAKKRAVLQLALNAVAEKETITAPSEDVARQCTDILGHNKDADPENVRVYVETMLTNEAVFRFLEQQR